MRFGLVCCLVSLLSAAGGLSNRRAPGFSLPDTTGRQHDLYDYRGKIVLIEIMQTACPHCRAFSKILDKVNAKYGDRVVTLSVVNPPDSAKTVAKYLAELKPSTPILFDAGQMAISYFKLTPANPAIDLPHLFIIDAKGWIVNDYEYDDSTMSVFEGDALFAELDKMLTAGKK